MLLPSSGLLRRADAVVVIGATLVAKAAGGGAPTDHRVAGSTGRRPRSVGGCAGSLSAPKTCRAVAQTSSAGQAAGRPGRGGPRPTSRSSTPGTPTRHRRRRATSGCCERVVENAKSVTNDSRDRRPHTNTPDTGETTCSRCDLQRYVAQHSQRYAAVPSLISPARGSSTGDDSSAAWVGWTGADPSRKMAG